MKSVQQKKTNGTKKTAVERIAAERAKVNGVLTAAEIEANVAKELARTAPTLESAAIGVFDTSPPYEMYEASTATMLATALARGDELLPLGIEAAADELAVFAIFVRSDEGREIDPRIAQSMADGIEARLRVLAVIARRTLNALVANAKAVRS